VREPGWIWRLVVLLLPGAWVLGVVVLSLALGARVQLTPLLAAAPVIACAGTGRRQCIVLGSLCALFVLVPIPGEPVGSGQRLGTLLAILIVAGASYLIAQRRLRMQRAYDEVRRIVDATQRILLRPVPERIGPVAAAAEYLSAADGARLGGDFYEIIDSPFGIRAILGDMRGSGLDAVGGAVALLGAFREAGAVESALETVAARLDAALTRHVAAARGPRPGPGPGNPSEYQGSHDGLWAEDFATAVLVEIPSGKGGDGGEGDGGYEARAGDLRVQHLGESGTSEGEGSHGTQGPETHGFARESVTRSAHKLNQPGVDEVVASPAIRSAHKLRLVVCGHPAPYLVRSGQARPLEAACPTLPLGLGSLVGEPYAAAASTVVFEPGDALVLYTDGISDARSRVGEFFPLADALRGLADPAPDAVTGRVRSRLLAHTHGTLNDDAAMMVLRSGGVGCDAA
jgi:Stage II sporulation protein E (SpoIIE)